MLNKEDFEITNYYVWCCDLDGGYWDGGVSIIINLLNSDKVFLYNKHIKLEESISTFNQGLEIANGWVDEHFELLFK